MQELTREELLDIQIEAAKFTKNVISTNIEVNALTICVLKEQILTLEKQLQHAESKNNQGA